MVLTQWIRERTDDVTFFNSVLHTYRTTLKTYSYDYQKPDVFVLRSCSTDIRPVAYSIPTSLLSFYLTGLPIKGNKFSAPTKIAIGVARIFFSAEVFRLGHSAGSYKQGSACMKKLIALQTPLGGEIAAIVRTKQPNHWLLQYERPPAELGIGEDGGSSRPRIATEANKQAKIDRDREQSEAAKAIAAAEAAQAGHSGGRGAAPAMNSTTTTSSGGDSFGGNDGGVWVDDVFGAVIGGGSGDSESESDGIENEAGGGVVSEHERLKEKRRRRRRYRSSSSVEQS